MTINELVMNFFRKQRDGVATLKQLYREIDDNRTSSTSKTPYNSARAVVYNHPADFKKIARGVYMLIGQKTASLLIEGDSRNLDEIEDNSIDCIITDHPWKDEKAHKSGNKRHFADYDTFRYEQSDFKAKARVLKEGAYLVEFLPVESTTNWEYLYDIKKMARENGLEYYTHCIWRNAPEGTMNTGKTTKGVQQLVIFSKGKPRKLSGPNVNAYQTKELLHYEIEMLMPRSAKDRHHQAEKPIELYEYLIRNLTEEKDICLDQFGGSCNMIQAAVNLNRFSIVYEISKEFVKNAVKRFNLTKLYDEDDAVADDKQIAVFRNEVGDSIMCYQNKGDRYVTKTDAEGIGEIHRFADKDAANMFVIEAMKTGTWTSVAT